MFGDRSAMIGRAVALRHAERVECFGIPRKIGAVAEQAMTYAMFAQKRTVSADMVLSGLLWMGCR